MYRVILFLFGGGRDVGFRMFDFGFIDFEFFDYYLGTRGTRAPARGYIIKALSSQSADIAVATKPKAWQQRQYFNAQNSIN